MAIDEIDNNNNEIDLLTIPTGFFNSFSSKSFRAPHELAEHVPKLVFKSPKSLLRNFPNSHYWIYSREVAARNQMTHVQSVELRIATMQDIA